VNFRTFLEIIIDQRKVLISYCFHETDRLKKDIKMS